MGRVAYASREITAVLALYGDVFGAGELRVEDWRWVSFLDCGNAWVRIDVPCVPHVKKKNMAAECVCWFAGCYTVLRVDACGD